MQDWNDRHKKICTALIDLDKNLRNILQNFDVSTMPTAQMRVSFQFFLFEFSRDLF